MAVVNDFVLAISTIGLRSTRAGGMGMNDKTRDAVFEIGTMYTRPEFRYRGISTTLSTIRLTVGIDTIIELAKSAIESGNGPKLERRLDKQIAEDLGGFNAERFLAALLSDDAIIRVFFENVKDQMPRVMKLATSLGFQQTAASTMLVERVLGDMVAVQEDADSPASLYLGQVYPKDGVGNDSHVQYLFKGSDSFARALRIATIIAERSGAEKSFEEGTEIVWDNNSPERIVYPADAGEVLVDLSNLSEEEASDRAKEIPGNVVVKMPAVKSSTVAWGLHRQK